MTYKKPNDLHLRIDGRYMVMVQWSDELTTRATRAPVALLTVSSRDNIISDESLRFMQDGLKAESVNLNDEQRRQVIEALEGNAPPCTCEVCRGDVHIGPADPSGV